MRARDDVLMLCAVILNKVKNLLACIVLSTLSLVGFEEMLRVARHDIIE